MGYSLAGHRGRGGEVGLEFVRTGDEPTGAVAEQLLAAVSAKFVLVDGARRRVNRVWLDTVDRRLAAAGLSLAHVTGAGRGELVLFDRGGSSGPGLGQRLPASPRWPSRLDAVPAGPVVDRLRPVVGVRALLPLAAVRSADRELLILNSDEKTVVRAWLDQAVPVLVDAEPLPARIRLLPVRGYEDQAARIARILVGDPGQPGFAENPPSELDLLLTAAARCGAGPEPVELPVLWSDQDASTALAAMLLRLLDTVEANVPGTVADLDTEFLHDLRVAVRRTRSALKLAGDALPGDLAERFSSEFRWLGDLTTPMRDLDTFLLGFDSSVGALADVDPADFEPYRAFLRRQRIGARRALLRGLRSDRFALLTSSWRRELIELVAAPTPRSGNARAVRAAGAARVTREVGSAKDRRDGLTAADLAADRTRRAWRRVIRRGAGLTAEAPPERLHDLRKRCKELRYVLEMFGPVFRPEPYRALVKELKVLQDCLGDFQDAEVHRDAVRDHAARMLAAGSATAPALLAMGALTTRLGEAQRLAGQDAASRFGAFATEANQQRVATLLDRADRACG